MCHCWLSGNLLPGKATDEKGLFSDGGGSCLGRTQHDDRCSEREPEFSRIKIKETCEGNSHTRGRPHDDAGGKGAQINIVFKQAYTLYSEMSIGR